MTGAFTKTGMIVSHRRLRRIAILAAVAAALGSVSALPAEADAGVQNLLVSGGAGTVTVGDTLYARQGSTVTVTVQTPGDVPVNCVKLTGATTQYQTGRRSSYSFSITAPAGDGPQVVNAYSSNSFDSSGCTHLYTPLQGDPAQISYTLDNTGPVVTAERTPAPNLAGWNNSPVTVKWTATDAGSGVAAAQPFKTWLESGPTMSSIPWYSEQSDRLGNHSGVAVDLVLRIDKTKPLITASQTANGNGTTTITFTCNDYVSSFDGYSGISRCVAEGTSPASNSKTVPGGTVVTGTAIDIAGNSSTASSTAPVNDRTAPTITHNVSPEPNAGGWNQADATVTFACTDNPGGSGINTCVADGTTGPSKTTTTETDGTAVSGTATDVAGNRATDVVTVKLDKTAPTAAATRSPAANGDGWNNSDVTVSFSGADTLSGVATRTADKVLTEGANQSASGTVTDAAGNTSTAAPITGINVDKTAPVLTGSSPSGWHSGDVTVRWSCTDALSGPAAQPAASTVAGEGDDRTATATCTDRAGNTAAKTVSGVQIDRTAPTTSVSGTSNNWTNSAVTVSLSAHDNLSGVASTHFTVDGGSPQTGTSFSLASEGDHIITFSSTDVAGVDEAVQTAHVKIDKTAPTISHDFSPLSYQDGAWTNSAVTVTFTCADQGGSNVASCSGPVTKTTEGSYPVTGTAIDGAGNTATDNASVRIDTTKPTITAQADRAANSHGWYADDVTVSYAAADALSGVRRTPASDVLHEGADQSASATVTDAAGNSANDGVTGINVDKTQPVLAATFATGWHTGEVTVNWSCTDSLSGVATGPTDDTVNGEGDLTSTASCIDRAGNTASRTVSGIKIDRTAPSTGISISGELTNGWYRQGTSVELTGSDNLSGVDATYYSVDGGAASTYSSAVSILADGSHTLTYWSVDHAGNVEGKTGNSITLDVDSTPPSLTGGDTPAANANGWFSGDVSVHWTCSDATSGLAGNGSCPADSTVSGEGDGLGASASVSDRAGNSTNTTAGGIRIDRSNPTTTASIADPLPTGWYGDAVKVTLTGHDNLSGIDATYYRVDAGAARTYDGAFSYGTDGSHTLTFWSRDGAGNVESAGPPITLNIDTTAPTTGVTRPVSPDSGWFATGGVPVAFQAEDSGSGIKATYYTIDGGAPRTYGQPFTADLTTGTHTITYWSVDLAGNQEPHATTNTRQVQVDTDAPTIKGAATPAPNSLGWNNSQVDVKFTCTDGGWGQSGVAGCAGDTTLTNDGENQSVHGDAVDVAGNRSSTDLTGINLDTTKPTLSGAPTTDASGTDLTGATWYRGDVDIAWTGVDQLSGINQATKPPNDTITAEGRSLSAGPVIIADQAGNISDSAAVTGINIDRSAPLITGTRPTGANAAGWYRNDVTVGFSCADPPLVDGSTGSGVAACPSDIMLKGDGADQSVTSVGATDVAGNASAAKTVTGINIDGREPRTTADNQCTATNGYCKGGTATVALSATDIGPSGVKEIHYAVNGGAEQVAAGASRTVVIPTDGTGHAIISYYAVDNAGNVEPAHQAGLDYDNLAPTITHTLSPAANAGDWNNSNVTVHFIATDADSGSGVDTTSVTPDVLIGTETTPNGTLVSGSAKDTAGNVGTDAVTVRLDKTAPRITAAIVPGSAMVNSWYTGAVKLHFTCADTGSGVGVCPDDVTVAANGANQSVTQSATDLAGNTASATVSGITIDNENPTVTSVNVGNGSYTLGAVPTPSCTATDSFSGLAGCKVTVAAGNTSGVGTFTYTATAVDKAGNTSATLSGSYRVSYRFDGFLQPINDTVHQVGTSTSVFKAGSTVPVKFQLKNSAGTSVQSPTAPIWLSPAKGSAMSAPVDESVYSASGDSGGTYRYDNTASQYLYTYKTGTGGNYYRLGMKLDDGQTYYVNVGLR